MMNVNLDAGSIGERVVIGLAILAMCAEMLSDNGCGIPPQPMAIADCVAVCDGRGIRRVESYACECEPAITKEKAWSTE